MNINMGINIIHYITFQIFGFVFKLWGVWVGGGVCIWLCACDYNGPGGQKRNFRCSGSGAEEM